MNARTRKGRWIVRERRKCRRDGFCAVCISPNMRVVLRMVLDLLDCDYHQLKARTTAFINGLSDSSEAPPGGVTGRRT